MRPQPNLAGFAESRRALRDRFGQDVAFLIPVARVEAPGTTDPESGEAFDPWGPPVSGGGAPTEVIKHLSVVSKPLGGVADAAQNTPIGHLATNQIAVIVPYEEWGDVAGATHVRWLDDRYKITETRDDAMATVYRRKIVYGTKT